MDGITVRPVREQDAEALAAIEKECFSLPLSKEQLLSQIRDEKVFLLTAEDPDGEPAGYAGYYAVLDEGYITNVAVREVFRRRHIADRLMEELEHRAKEDALAFLTLEVRESNAPAVALYSKHGFETRGLRKHYYERPRENALIMTLDLK
jgi:ribosomal-protein-alanine N-acetyltransferase